MADSNMDRLKKIIEDKKLKNKGNDSNVRPDRSIGGKSHTAFVNKKTEGSVNKI